MPFINEKKLRQSIRVSLDAAARQVQKELEKTVETFETKIKFRSERTSEYEREIYTTHKVYKWLDEGTKKHFIKRKKKVFRFQANYKAKTKPKVIASSSGGANGPIVYTRKSKIRHPGTKARKFTKIIKDKWQPRMIYFMQRAIDAGVE